jgi:very-short-patch-repair endonuclease
MLTGVFRDRTRQRTAQNAVDALGQLLQSRSLRPHRFHRNIEIGPFRVGYACLQAGLIVELRASSPPDNALLGPSPEHKVREQSRRALLRELGYSLLLITPHELLTRPDQALARIRAALR